MRLDRSPHHAAEVICSALLIPLLLLVPTGALGREGLEEEKYDPENAEEIFHTCAGCHGKEGEGGKQGTYPRLAGLSAKYIAAQLRAFKARERVNIPMFPYATERELPEDDVRDISIYLSKIELLTEMPPNNESLSALERLLLARRVFNVPRVDGDVERGRRLYRETCRRCHGRLGKGKGEAPRLAGQYTQYLRRQIGLFLDGSRENRRMTEVLETLQAEDFEDIFAFLASLDD